MSSCAENGSFAIVTAAAADRWGVEGNRLDPLDMFMYRDDGFLSFRSRRFNAIKFLPSANLFARSDSINVIIRFDMGQSKVFGNQLARHVTCYSFVFFFR